jgi:hypothetical protein
MLSQKVASVVHKDGMVGGSAERVATMGSIEGTGVLVVGIAVALFVPVVVWVMVIAGLIQIVRDKIRETRLDQGDPGQEAQQPMGHN